MMLMPLALAGCATTSVFAPKSSCSDLLDGTWEQPVADAAAPRQGATDLDTLKSWIGFAGAQTAGKRSEFERAQAARAIIRRCEERDRTAIERARPKFLGLF
ncbi:MAG: hypothetical protein U0975_08835 [Erythrobacter sp.]|nr:hypothetical protein [Erythrobacter sp.]